MYDIFVYTNSMEMNDKHDEPPQIPDGYGLSVAYACLVDTVRAIQIEISLDIYQPDALSPQIFNAEAPCSGNEYHLNSTHQKVKSSKTEDNDNSQNSEQRPTATEAKRSLLHEQIINNSWSGLLTVFCPLIESWYVIYYIVFFLNIVTNKFK